MPAPPPPPSPAVRLSPRKRIVPPKAGEAKRERKKARDRKSRRINFLMRAVSPSRKQDAPPATVNELAPDSQRPRPNEKLPDRRGPPDRSAQHFLHPRRRARPVRSSVRPGSGKTTLLGLAAGLDLPTSGSVLLNGIALAEISEDERARVRNEHVGFVFQNFQLIPTLTALENVTVPMELRGDRSARTLGARPPASASGSESGAIIIRRSFPAANNSASRSRGPSSTGRKFSLPTSRPAISTRRRARR